MYIGARDHVFLMCRLRLYNIGRLLRTCSFSTASEKTQGGMCPAIIAAFFMGVLQLATSQVTFPTTATPSCLVNPSDFGYPSDCPTYTPGADIQTLATDSCKTLCSSKCIDPLISYMESCSVDTSALKAWCGTSSGNGELCCTLGTTLSGALTGLGFFTFCSNGLTCGSGLVRSQCTNAYDSYGCCFANFNEVDDLHFDWSACGFSTPDTCYYDWWPLPISKELLIGLVVGVGGGLLLLCIACLVGVCCCVFVAASAGGRRRTTKVSTSGKPCNSEDAGVEYRQFP